MTIEDVAKKCVYVQVRSRWVSICQSITLPLVIERHGFRVVKSRSKDVGHLEIQIRPHGLLKCADYERR